MKRTFSVSVWREGDAFVAQCLDVDVGSQGESEGEALRLTNLEAALDLYISVPVATRRPMSRIN